MCTAIVMYLSKDYGESLSECISLRRHFADANSDAKKAQGGSECLAWSISVDRISAAAHGMRQTEQVRAKRSTNDDRCRIDLLGSLDRHACHVLDLLVAIFAWQGFCGIFRTPSLRLLLTCLPDSRIRNLR